MPWDTTRSAHTAHAFRSWVLWSFLEAGPAPWMPASLSLLGNFDGTRGIRCLAESPYLREIRELNLLAAGVDAESLQVLVSSEYLGALEVLRLDSNSLGDAGMQVLARAPKLASLRTLDVAFCDIGDVGVSALAGSPYLRELRDLDLRANPFTDAGVQELARSPNLATVEVLHLSLTASPVGRQRLFFSTQLPYSCPSGKLTQEGVSALAKSPYTAKLCTLSLSYQPLGGWLMLAASSRMPSLRLLRAYGSHIHTTVVEANPIWFSPYLASVRIESSSTPSRRTDIQQQPQKAWETETDPKWRLFAYACLTLAEQESQTTAYLAFREQIARTTELIGKMWYRQHLSTWTGERLRLAAERFPEFEEVQQKWAGAVCEQRWRVSLEEALFSG